MLRTAIAGFVGVLVGAAVVGMGTGQVDEQKPRLNRLQGKIGGASSFTQELRARMRYPWLPAELREPYIPCRGEWQALRHDAGSMPCGYDYLVARTCDTAIWSHGLHALMNCEYQPGKGRAWDNASDRVKRGEFLSIGTGEFKGVQAYLLGVPRERVILSFGIMGGHVVAVWHDGKVYLRGEPGFSERAEFSGKFFEQMEE